MRKTAKNDDDDDDDGDDYNGQSNSLFKRPNSNSFLSSCFFSRCCFICHPLSHRDRFPR